MKPGKLYGVGVGPGAPDLLTLRAVDVLRRAHVLAIPRASQYATSLAWRIAAPAVGDVAGQERLFFEFPMSKDPSLLRPAWETALDAMGERLLAGRSVAFLCEGDSLVYGTFVYLLRAARVRWPEVEIEVVPGVSSISAVPAVLQVPLADGVERVAILPATHAVDDLVPVLEQFDTTLLLKVGSVMRQAVAALERTGLVDRATYVSRATTAEQRIVRDVRTLRSDKCDYFSMLVVRRDERSGRLMDGDGPKDDGST